MKIQPLGPEAIQARIQEIRDRLSEVSGQPSFNEITQHIVPNVFLSSSSQFGTGIGAGFIAPLNVFGDQNESGTLSTLADQIADEHGIDRKLFRALISAESSWNPKTVSSAGAMGLTQLMPETAKSLGVLDPFDPVQNLQGGAKYLRRQLDTFGSIELALAAYNAGPGAVRRYGGVPPYRETQNYVRKILGAIGQ
jgi:hypothetical protein